VAVGIGVSGRIFQPDEAHQTVACAFSANFCPMFSAALAEKANRKT
jgi:hypothetical protein